MIPLRCVGIDVSKHFLDIFDEAIGASERIANATQAITQQVARSAGCAVFFEATVSSTPSFARRCLMPPSASPGSTRPVPATSHGPAANSPRPIRLTRECWRPLPVPSSPPAEQIPTSACDAFARLAKRRVLLVLMRAQEKNRRSEADDRAMAERIGRFLEVLEGEIREDQADIRALIKAEQEISDDAQLMRSLPGIGPVACMQLIAQMPELGQVGPKQIAALAGLAPLQCRQRNRPGASAKLAAVANASATPSTWPPSTRSAGQTPSKPSTHGCGKPANQQSSP